MNIPNQQEKNAKIGATYAATKLKRKQQVCHVRTIKIKANKLSGEQKEALQVVFIEAKWMTNAVLSWINDGNILSDYDSKSTIVIHKDKDQNNVETEFKYLGSQVRQSVVSSVADNLKTLATLKEKDCKVGRLKFRKECKSLELKQHGTTYQLKNSRLKIQGIPGWLTVSGIEQLKDFELANAKLFNKPDGYYLAVTCYRNKEEEPKPTKFEIGIDLGCKTTVTLSDGRKFIAKFQESDRLKRLQRKLSRQQKMSKGWLRTLNLIHVEYQKMTALKNDAANKIVAEVKQYKYIYMQDEMLKSWHAGHFGRSVQMSVLGRVKAKLKPIATCILPSSAPTTKLCYGCGQVHDIPLSQRTYVCDCGIDPEDRDVHSGKNMIFLGKKYLADSIRVPAGRREFKRVDQDATAGTVNSFGKQLGMKREAPGHLA